jgi:hypothetical protein
MSRKEKKYHFIYKTTNLLSGKYYLGMHSTDNLNDGYMGSGKRLRYSINKYGKENHKVEILEFVDSRPELKAREAEIVNLNEIAKEDCMNLKVGGYGGFTNEIQQMGSKATNELMKTLRENDPEWVNRVSENISNSLKTQYQNGKRKVTGDLSFKDRTHSKESKCKMSEKAKQRTGKANSQFGTCWITNAKEVKKIKKEDLDFYLKNGWKIGRKF